jgi:hypothetical protein
LTGGRGRDSIARRMVDPTTGPPPAERPETGPIPLLASRPENCPNCGKPLPDDESVVCVSCGYDLRSVQVRPTIVGPAVETEPERPKLPLVRERLHWKVMAGIAGAAILVMVIAFLAGAPGLFPRHDGKFADPSGAYTSSRPVGGDRVAAAIRYLGLQGILIGAGVVALFVHGHLRSAPVGDRRAAVAAIAAIMGVASLLNLIALPHGGLEHGLEFFGQCGAAALGFMICFRIRPVDAVVTAGVAVLALLFTIGAAHFVVWIV